MTVLLSRALADAMAKPRRAVWLPTPDELQELSRVFRRPGSAFEFRPLQAVGIAEMHEARGLFGILPVGTGKTVLAALAPRILQASPAVFMCPAGNKESLELAFRALQKDIDFPWPTWVTYNQLSTDPEVLQRLRPKLITCDEIHMLKDPKSGRTIRFDAYLDEEPETLVVGLTGTPTLNTIYDYVHLMLRCIPEYAPVPIHYDTLKRLAGAVDRKPRERHSPGALLGWATPEQANRAAARGKAATAVAQEIWALRLAETLGVITADESSCSQTLTVTVIRTHPVPPAVAEAVDRLDRCWETPAGEPFGDALTKDRFQHQLNVGVYYQPTNVMPEPWRDARLAWAQAVRRAIFSLRRGLATEGEVRAACARGELPVEVRQAWATWAELEPTFVPRNRAVWLDDFAIRYAREWAAGGGLIWVDIIALGTRLALELGLPYYRQKARTKQGVHIDNHPGGTAIVSLDSCRQSLNLQWASRNLFLGCMPCDQSLGRTHRAGQTKPVTAEVFVSSKLSDGALTRAQEQSRFNEVQSVPSVFGRLAIQEATWSSQ